MFLEQVNSCKYLAVTVNSKGYLLVDEDISEGQDKVEKLCNAFRRHFIGKKEVRNKVAVPFLIYGSES